MKKQEREQRNKYVRHLLEAANYDVAFHPKECKPQLTEDRLRAEYTFLRGIWYWIMATNRPKSQEVGLAMDICRRRWQGVRAFKERT